MEFVLMADIVKSSDKDAPRLMSAFKDLVNIVNTSNSDKIKSPLTITLGDEFQGIAKGLNEAVAVIFELEEMRVELELDFKLRYVVKEGEVETPINTEIAYEMLGEGLTQARKNLDALKKTDRRFGISLRNKQLEKQYTRSMFIYQHFVDHWKPKDKQEVSLFLKGMDYQAVAKALSKDESSVWRRERSLNMREYVACKQLILNLK